MLLSNYMKKHTSYMKKHTSKYGTDDRYPYWKGGAIDPKTINGFVTIAYVLNWSAIAFVFVPINLTNSTYNLPRLTARIGIAIFVCILTMLPIRHEDRYVQWYMRGFASGIPLVLILFIVWRLANLNTAMASME